MDQPAASSERTVPRFLLEQASRNPYWGGSRFSKHPDDELFSPNLRKTTFELSVNSATDHPVFCVLAGFVPSLQALPFFLSPLSQTCRREADVSFC
jgi:hypothetical protein